VPRSGLADFALAMQGLGSAPVTLFGSHEQKQALLPGVAAGTTVAAFALSEPDVGSDVAAMSCTATRLPGGGWRLDGSKTWISNAGIADSYVIFARSGEAPGAKGISAFIVDARTPGLDASERIDVIAPHPLGTLRLADCRVADDRLLGEAGAGLQDRDGHAGQLSHHGRCGGIGLCAARARRGLAAIDAAQDVRPHAGRLPAHARSSAR